VTFRAVVKGGLASVEDRAALRQYLSTFADGTKLTVEISKYRRVRSTGPNSQCAHLHGHLQQIGRELGYSLEEVKAVMKADCIDWPHSKVTVHGRTVMVPISEADATTDVESAAIEWCHMRAAEQSILLREES
jgi:hypothetical protein